MPPEPLVSMQNVSKAFTDARRAKRPAVCDVSGVVERGRVTGLIGADGSGKTTLLRLIAGLLLPDTGRLRVCGFDTTGSTAGLRHVVSYMPQRFGLYEDLTVQENLTLYADLRSVRGILRTETFERLIAFAGLAAHTERLAGALSGGMKQKLGLACAMIRPPRLLLLDEPSVGVDPISRRDLWALVAGLTTSGMGVLWSTAYLDEAEKCETVILLSEGRVAFQGNPSELTRQAAGRVYALRQVAPFRRAVLARALSRVDVVDAVPQGRDVRLVLAAGAAPPLAADYGLGDTARVTAETPRFEDAFMMLLGGVSKVVGETAPDGRATPLGAEQVMVQADRLTRRYGAFIAADAVSFSVKRGEIFGLLGPNGAGKSTIFRMLCGLLQASSGVAQIAGLDLARAGNAARSKLGYMPQKFSLYGDLSVRQNLAFFAGVYGLRDQHSVIERTTKIFGLANFLNDNARDLPLGYKQRLSLACAIMHEPAVLFLDEPTSGVDPRARREFWGRINAMVAQGVTVVVTTHFLDEAEYCDRIGLIYRGHLIATGSPDELKRGQELAAQPHPTLEDAYINLVAAYDHRAQA